MTQEDRDRLDSVFDANLDRHSRVAVEAVVALFGEVLARHERRLDAQQAQIDALTSAPRSPADLFAYVAPLSV